MHQRKIGPWWVALPLSEPGVGIQIQNALERLCGIVIKSFSQVVRDDQALGGFQLEVIDVTRNGLGTLIRLGAPLDFSTLVGLQPQLWGSVTLWYRSWNPWIGTPLGSRNGTSSSNAAGNKVDQILALHPVLW